MKPPSENAKWCLYTIAYFMFCCLDFSRGDWLFGTVWFAMTLLGLFVVDFEYMHGSAGENVE